VSNKQDELLDKTTHDQDLLLMNEDDLQTPGLFRDSNLLDSKHGSSFRSCQLPMSLLRESTINDQFSPKDTDVKPSLLSNVDPAETPALLVSHINLETT
jgi:hypothetical protein